MGENFFEKTCSVFGSVSFCSASAKNFHSGASLINVFVCVSLTFLNSMTDVLQAESCMSHFCSPSAFFRAFAVHL